MVAPLGPLQEALQRGLFFGCLAWLYVYILPSNTLCTRPHPQGLNRVKRLASDRSLEVTGRCSDMVVDDDGSSLFHLRYSSQKRSPDASGIYFVSIDPGPMFGFFDPKRRKWSWAEGGQIGWVATFPFSILGTSPFLVKFNGQHKTFECMINLEKKSRPLSMVRSMTEANLMERLGNKPAHNLHDRSTLASGEFIWFPTLSIMIGSQPCKFCLFALFWNYVRQHSMECEWNTRANKCHFISTKNLNWQHFPSETGQISWVPFPPSVRKPPNLMVSFGNRTNRIQREGSSSKDRGQQGPIFVVISFCSTFLFLEGSAWQGKLDFIANYRKPMPSIDSFKWERDWNRASSLSRLSHKLPCLPSFMALTWKADHFRYCWF